ncbi:hypothetical protein P9112_005618 [Eukaryota sp. TZLM1-RC]
MALPQQWRRFNFFTKKDNIHASTVGSYLQNIDIMCVATCKGLLFFGDSKGSIHFCDRSYRFTSFRAHEGAVCSIITPQTSNCIITAGCDEEGREWKVSIWSLRQTNPSGHPSLLRKLNVSSTTDVSQPITRLCTSEDMSHLAVALANGSIILFHGDLLKDRKVSGKNIYEGDSPATGLSFQKLPNNEGYGLFASTRSSVVLFKITSSNVIKVDLENPKAKIGCPSGCSTFLRHNQEFAVATESVVWYYGLDGKHGASFFEGPKRLITSFRQYLVILTPPERNSCVLGIYDLKNQCVVYYDQKIGEARFVFSEWGFLFVLTSSKQLIQLEEKDLTTKLDLLYKKSWFEAAISLARQSVSDHDLIADVYRRYGDHLYRKGDYSAAMNKYLQTIGGLEPSYVIRRFLNGQLIVHLAKYLKSLHDRKLANSDHTSLLLNCYTKLKNVKGNSKDLKDFIETNNTFDVGTAIQVFLSSEYCEYALFLAKKHGYHIWVVKILVDFYNDHVGVLNYIRDAMTSDPKSVGDVLVNYGRTLVNSCPDDVTKLLIEFCTGKLSATPHHLIEDFLPIFIAHPKHLIKLLECLLPHTSETAVVVNTLLELYLSMLTSDDQNESGWAGKIIKLLKEYNGDFEVERAFILLKRSNFKPGLLFLYQQLNMLTEVARILVDDQSDDALLALCQEHGKKDHSLWFPALQRFSKASSNHYLEKALNSLAGVSEIPPLNILKILATSTDTPLSIVKNYVIELVKRDQRKISEDEAEISRIKNQISIMEDQLATLKTKPQIFQSSKCLLCTQPLSLPATHFLCSHSFHSNCLGDNDHRCPICADEQDQKLAMIKTGRLTMDEIQQFFKQLDVRGFATVPSFISRGVFSRSTTCDEPVLMSPVFNDDNDTVGDFSPYQKEREIEHLDWDFQ